jgi:hypothetical protein
MLHCRSLKRTVPFGLKNRRNGSPKKLVISHDYFYFYSTNKSTLKTRTPINISKLFFGKPLGFIDGFGFCCNFGGQGKNEKSIITSGY